MSRRDGKNNSVGLDIGTLLPRRSARTRSESKSATSAFRYTCGGIPAVAVATE